MPLSRSRDYLSIGEVLESVREDFPDISISKIRFLESEGLIDPERTGAGYRKFYEADVERLKYILELQRDHFMPLKVIKERLAEADARGGVYTPAPPPAPTNGSAEPEDPTAGTDMTGVQMDRDELCAAAGLSPDELDGLIDFGLMPAKGEGGYDENDLLVAKAARRFFQYGIEPRHLRMYRQFAEREADFFQRIVSPMTRRRDPEGRREARSSVHELLGLSRQLREGVLRSNLDELL